MYCIRLRSFSTTMWNYLHGNGCIWQCYDFISSTCDPWQQRFLSAPFYAHPIIRFYTINYIPLLFLSLSPSPTTLSDSWSGLVFWQTKPLICSAPSPPVSKPHFHEPNPPEGLRDSSFFFVTHTLCNWVLVVRSRVRDQGCNVVHLLPIFCPRLHYEHGGREPQHRHKHRDRGKKNKAVSFSFFCAVPFRWCSLINGRITGSRLFWFH